MPLTVRTNDALRALGAGPARKLDRGLRTLLDEGFVVDDDHVLLARHAPTAPPRRITIFGDDVGYEGSVNHVHVESEVTTWRGHRDWAGQGQAYALELARRLEATFPDAPFDVWLIDDAETWTVRFHEHRDGVAGWLSDAEFESEAPTLVVEVRPA